MNSRGKRNQEKELRKRKEWLEYIDKLIARESSKYNRIGITIWVIIAAIAVLLINIIDILYQIPSLDKRIIIDLYCLYSVTLTLLYVIISTFKPQLNRYQDFFPSRIDTNRNYFFIALILLITILMYISTKTFKHVYLIISYLLVLLIQSNRWLYLEKSRILKIDMVLHKIYMFNLKMRNYYKIIILSLCLFLYIFDYKTLFVSIEKEIILLSLFSYTFFFLLILLFYLLVGDFTLQYLKQIENNIIMNLIKEKDIKQYFVTYFIGDDIKKKIDEEANLTKKTFNAYEFEEKMFSRKLKEMLSNPDNIPDNIKEKSINELYGSILKMKEKLTETYISMINQQVHFIFRKYTKDVIRDQDDTLRRLKKIIKEINSQIKIIRTLQKNEKTKKSEVYEGLDTQT